MLIEALILVAGVGPQAAAVARLPLWRKVVLDASFRSEGVAVADVNRDGLPDVLAGELWYRAPNWVPNEIAPPGQYDPVNGYSECFAAFAQDVDQDGWPDLVSIGFPSAPCHWFQNPQVAGVHWARHIVWSNACNESPAFHDVDGDGVRELILGSQPEQQLLWLEPGSDPTLPWIARPISAPGQPGADTFYHGLGVGDVDRDGRRDVLTVDGWYRAPLVPSATPWPFQPVDWHGASPHGPQGAAQIAVFDADGDGRSDIATSSPHAYGVWLWRQTPAGTFQELRISDSFSQSHALNAADVDRDGLTDLVTGKRWYAHGPAGDPGSQEPAVVQWFRLVRRPGGAGYVPQVIDTDSGVGTQFELADMDLDGWLDVVVSNKKGVAIHYQRR